MRIYIIRHGDPDYANDTITPDGHKEAEAVARRMKAVGVDRIYTSPMGRAIDTARYTTELTGIEMTIEPWTAELRRVVLDVPPWGRVHGWDVPGEVIRGGTESRDPYPRAMDNPFDRDQFEPVFAKVSADSDLFLARHGYVRDGERYRAERANSERIAVFCHGGFGLTWLAHLLEVPLALMWSGFWLSPTSVTTVFLEQRSKEWAVPRCLSIGDTSHLYAAGLPVNPRGNHALNW